MAPQRMYTTTTAFSAQVKSSDEESILVESGGFTPMRWFLERGAHANTDRDEPVLKKRRLTKEDEKVESPSQQTAATSNQIPLFEITVDIRFPESLRTDVTHEENAIKDVAFPDNAAVSVMPFRVESEDGGTQIGITLPQDDSPLLFIECSPIPKDVVVLLGRIGVSNKNSSKMKRSGSHDNHASKLSCTLTCASEPLINVVRMRVRLTWESGKSAFAPYDLPTSSSRVPRSYDHLLIAFPNHSHDQIDHRYRWTPQEFYESVHATCKDEDTSDLYPNVLQSDLYPFQKRAVTWMLKREGIVCKGGVLGAMPVKERHAQSVSLYETRTDLDGRECSVNYVNGIVDHDTRPDRPFTPSGGLLAEEMGLGKTVELLALIILHKRGSILKAKVKDEPGVSTLPSKATLIICPASILPQWRSEIQRHAPGLHVYQYDGVAAGKKAAASKKTVLEDLAYKYDVVLTTYRILAKEVHYAEDPPDRNMRHERKFERERSPLVQVQWWRICLDEAQMVEAAFTPAARVANCLQRVHSWAVSGTPFRKNVEDLRGLLIFLQYWPFNENSKLWNQIVRSHRNKFRQIFGQIALRHTKALVREELLLPPQKRVVVTVPFSAVELQNYDSLYNAMCDEVGVNTDGSPKSGTWDPQDSSTVEAMRSWLVRLRQTCLHPQVGGRNRQALGRGQKPLRTVAEVLQVMIEQVETGIHAEEKNVIASSLLRAHILGNNGDDTRRSEKALEIYSAAIEASGTILQETRERLAAAEAAQEEEAMAVETEDESSSSESSPLSGRLRNSVRVALQLHHKCVFFAATSYFQIKTNEDLTKPDSDAFNELERQETELYQKAKIMRKELLKGPSQKAEASMHQIRKMKDDGKFTKLPIVRDLENLGGIESRRIVERSRKLFQVIREQAKVIVEWREKMADFLLKPLVDEDEGLETTGDEYEDSTKQQDELYVYFDAFKAIHADLNTGITGESAPLIDHEAKALLRDARLALDAKVLAENKPNVHHPELVVELLTQRNELRARYDKGTSLRGLIQEARGLEGSMQSNDPKSRANAEHAIIQRYLAHLQPDFTSYSKALTRLEKEIELFRNTQNQRVNFYRQLQEISDDVAPYKPELDPVLDVRALNSVVQNEDNQNRLLAQSKTKHRFLLHIQDETDSQSGPRICVICQSSFEHGVLTVCGHQYCKECIHHWFNQSKNCPVCKKRLTAVDLHDITYRPQEIRVKEELQNAEGSSTNESGSALASKASLYSDVDSNIMDEIKSIDLPSSYGTKIDTIGRHLHWIREHDPRAKSIVFSQYREFLDVLGAALTDFKIGHCRLGRSGATEKFRNDANIDCLLLDAKTDSSGLTLVNATHVFICEPLIQTAVELQAIARVHRIGQTRPTTVWMYLINDTVEEAIYEISVARRLAHVQSRSEQSKRAISTVTSRVASPAPLHENAIDAANSAELQSAPLAKLLEGGKGGGELVKTDDLWQCLFGKSHKTAPIVSPAIEREVGRHLRAEAAMERQEGT